MNVRARDWHDVLTETPTLGVAKVWLDADRNLDSEMVFEMAQRIHALNLVVEMRVYNVADATKAHRYRVYAQSERAKPDRDRAYLFLDITGRQLFSHLLNLYAEHTNKYVPDQNPEPFVRDTRRRRMML